MSMRVAYSLHRQLPGPLPVLATRFLEAATKKQQCFSTASRRTNDRFRRRKRPNFGVLKVEGNGPPRALPEKTGLDSPVSFGGEDGEDYHKKTSLSPWVPLPDPIARKLFDLTAPTPEDIHVDLGCGDGRINFYAIDHGKVKKSIGIDVDEKILGQANERLKRRYPQPPIKFVQADLLDFSNDEIWDTISEATILTMYFVEDALQKIKPILEEKLAGKQCKIITCGYEMKGWNHWMRDTTLGLTCYLYNWGSHDDDDNNAEPFFTEDDMLGNLRPKEMLEDPLAHMEGQPQPQPQQFEQSEIEKIIASIPNRNERNSEDYWTDDEDDEEDEADQLDEKEEKLKSKAKNSTPCSRKQHGTKIG